MRHDFARPDSRPLPAPCARTLALIARLRRAPVALADLHERDDDMRALAIAQARGLARLALDAAGIAYVIRERGGR